jgi:tryptophanyl-tRNA synthetase
MKQERKCPIQERVENIKKILVGIQPSGKIHIGNYLGCLKRGIELQNQGHDVTFLIANYHSLTTDSYSDLTESELVKLGCKNIKRQTPEYTELFFKLCCKLNLGILQRMPQYKDKKDNVEFDLGLLLYPVLMTADIMINDPDIVIIGKDQVAHLELCNDISKRLGGREYKYEFGDVDKIMSLQDPEKKMSKSLGDRHILNIFNEDYEKKIKRANANELGLKNLKIIAQGLGLNVENYTLNIELKMAMIDKMKELFTI